MAADGYWRNARYVRTVDGDTMDLDIDLGFHLTARHRVRLLGIDTPETNSRDPNERAVAVRATQFVIDWMAAAIGASLFPLHIRTEKADSFGRYLAEVWFEGRCLNQDLVRAGLAVSRRVN